MSAKTRSSTKRHATKVLAIFTLLACINAVSAASVSKGVASRSQTLETVNMGNADVSKRFLRADNVITTDDRINTFQERSLAVSLPGLQNVATSIKTRLSTLIQKLQLQWWRLRQKSPNDVFTLLKLDKTGDKLFESPVFSQWVAFVTVRRKNDPDMAMFSTLATHYSDDALAKMLVTAKKADSSNAIVTKIEGLQMANWLHAGNSADDVFKALKLDQTGDKLFESPLFTYWSSFVGKRYTKDSGAEVFTTFGKHYSDDALAKILPTHILATAKNVDSTKTMATKLEGLQITTWVNAQKSADDVFKILKLDQTGDKLFESPVFSTWITFVSKINRNDPNEAILTHLTDKLGDVALAKMISAANNADDSTKKLAIDLRSVQFTNWFNEGRTPQRLNTLLNVAENSDGVTTKISKDYEKFYTLIDSRLAMGTA